jgi:UDP-2,3-diacylglucosamine hydrolase
LTRGELFHLAYYFASDVHLRFDRPERDRRFNDWLCRLTRDDQLVIGGDLCDFWMGARSAEKDLLDCASLRAFAEFRRRGGSLFIMPGNHDAWLCARYQRLLGAQIIAEPYDLSIDGLRIRLVHGHLLGARRRWKSWMESRVFFEGFGRLPGPIARVLDHSLERSNERRLVADEDRHLEVYRQYAAAQRGSVDIVAVGHVHRPVDEADTSPRLIVLGGWLNRASYLKVDEAGAVLHVETGEGLSLETANRWSQERESHEFKPDES